MSIKSGVLQKKGFVLTNAGWVRKKVAPSKKKGMNGTETRYLREILEPAKKAGTLVDFRFESLKLKLDDGVTYTPDFMIWRQDGSIEFHEVKGGFVREDAKLKFIWAIQRFSCFRFAMMQYKNGTWDCIRDSSSFGSPRQSSAPSS